MECPVNAHEPPFALLDSKTDHDKPCTATAYLSPVTVKATGAQRKAYRTRIVYCLLKACRRGGTRVDALAENARPLPEIGNWRD
jgi:hypothetical protein